MCDFVCLGGTQGVVPKRVLLSWTISRKTYIDIDLSVIDNIECD